MYKASLSEQLEDNRIRCNICQWRCVINEGKSGVCRMYKNEGGTLYSINYALASSVAVDPIEKKPLYHFYPGSRVFSLGGWGCNFHCKDCQNWQISCVDNGFLKGESREVLPDEAVELALNYNCAGIAWTYNEPTMWFEYTLDSARLAKQKDLYTVYVTNGYMTLEALDAIGPYLDAWRVDVKGFSNELYMNLANIKNWRSILDVASRAKKRWDMHIEVVTNIIPTMNDDDYQLEGIAHWIHDELGELTPWHVTRYHPQYKILDIPATPLSTLERAYETGKRAGLKFVYVGNVPGHKSETTVCYNCGMEVIQRMGYVTDAGDVEDSRCPGCGAELNIRM